MRCSGCTAINARVCYGPRSVSVRYSVCYLLSVKVYGVQIFTEHSGSHVRLRFLLTTGDTELSVHFTNAGA